MDQSEVRLDWCQFKGVWKYAWSEGRSSPVPSAGMPSAVLFWPPLVTRVLLEFSAASDILSEKLRIEWELKVGKSELSMRCLNNKRCMTLGGYCVQLEVDEL